MRNDREPSYAAGILVIAATVLLFVLALWLSFNIGQWLAGAIAG